MSTAVNAMKDRVQDRVNAWLGRPPTGAEHAVRVPRLPTGPAFYGFRRGTQRWCGVDEVSCHTLK